MSEGSLEIASERLSKPDQASNVEKDESEPVISVQHQNRDDALEEIDNKHEIIPPQEEPHQKLELPEENEEAKSHQEPVSPKTAFTESHHGFHAKNGLAHLPTDANDTNETMHTHDINSVLRDPFGSTQRHEMKNIGIGTSDDFESLHVISGPETKDFIARSNDSSPGSTKSKKTTKYNYEEKLKGERMRKLQQRQRELSKKIEELHVEQTVEKTAKSVERVKEEIDRLIPVMAELSPENTKPKKRSKYKANSEIEKEVYNKDKLKLTHDTIEKIKLDQMEHRSKIQKELEMEKIKDKIRMETLQKSAQEESERRRAYKKTKLEMTLREINERNKERVKKQEEWKKQNEDSKQYHYLYQIKEEDWSRIEQKEKSIQQKELEKRSNIFKPHEDNMHKQWSSAVLKKRKEMMDNLKQVREHSNSPPQVLENVYHGHFHFLLEKEEEIMRSMNDEKQRAVREYNKKRQQFDEMIKKTVKLKFKKFDPEEEKKQPTALDLKVQSVKAKQVHSHKELVEMGNKNLEEARAIIRKNKSSSNVQRSETYRKTTAHPPDTAKSEFASPTRINYLPELKKYLTEKKKKSNLESLMASDVPDSEKYYLLRAQIDKLDDNTKFTEKKLKYGKDRNQMELDKNQLDEYNISSLKAKIAILNGLHS